MEKGGRKWAQCRPQVYQLNCCHIDLRYGCVSCTFMVAFPAAIFVACFGHCYFNKSMFQFPNTDHSKKVQLIVIDLENTYMYRTFCCTK